MKGVANKKYRPYVKAAVKHGATLRNGRGHMKLYDADGNYLVSLPHGQMKHEGGPGDMADIKKIWRERGWLK